MLNGDLRNTVTTTAHPDGREEVKRIMEYMIYEPLKEVPWDVKVRRWEKTHGEGV